MKELHKFTEKKKQVKKWSITGKPFFLKGKFIKVLELDLPAIFFPLKFISLLLFGVKMS